MSNFAFVVFCLATEAVLVVLSQPATTVCQGGPFCQQDSDCQPLQRCLETPCGQKRCSIAEITRDPCRGFCLNRGLCTAPADAPSCTCQKGFSGTRCEVSTNTRPGTCPVIRKDDIGVCGGTPCTYDQQCGYNQKCCPSACGGKLCTNTGIIIDPCSGFCLNGGTCTAPADAPSCRCPTGFSGTRCETPSRPGTCPKGDISVCGGVPCTYDEQCGPNQKCCAVACGGTFCTNVEEPQTLTCANVLCNVGNVCRYVSSCSTCPTQPRCIPVDQVYDGIDNECRRGNYTEVILAENPSNSSAFRPLNCAPRYRTCPSGSECAGDRCCRGKVTVPLTKPGLCPTSQVSACNGTACTNDYDCPGEQKCCPECNVCRDPIFVLNQDGCKNTRCPPGFVCDYRTPDCPPGRLCLQALLPVCVRSECVNCTSNQACVPKGYGYGCSTVNECGVCPRGQVCKPTNIRCVTQPCPQFACVPIDRCGGCPPGQVCRLNSCTTKACASYKCYPATY